MITREQYEEYKKLVEEYEQAEFVDGLYEDEDNDFNDDHNEEDFDEYDSRHACECGAWKYGPKGFMHLADCICGAE